MKELSEQIQDEMDERDEAEKLAEKIQDVIPEESREEFEQAVQELTEEEVSDAEQEKEEEVPQELLDFAKFQTQLAGKSRIARYATMIGRKETEVGGQNRIGITRRDKNQSKKARKTEKNSRRKNRGK